MKRWLALLLPLLLPFAARAECAPSPDGPAACLVGTIVSPGYSVAFLARPDAPLEERVSVGGQIDGWRVLAIAADAVTLGRQDRQATLTLHAAEPDGAKTQASSGSPSASIAGQAMHVRLIRRQERQSS